MFRRSGVFLKYKSSFQKYDKRQSPISRDSFKNFFAWLACTTALIAVCNKLFRGNFLGYVEDYNKVVFPIDIRPKPKTAPKDCSGFAIDDPTLRSKQ